jgi:hypothetical protein
MAARILPTGNAQRIAWALNFEEKFPELGADLGFLPAEITAMVNASAAMRLSILNAQLAAVFAKASTGYKNDMLGGVGDNVATPSIPTFNAPDAIAAGVEPGVLEFLSKGLQRAKLHKNFNHGVAESLQILGDESDSAIPPDGKPKGEATAMVMSVVRLDWTKGKADGVYIDSQRGDETEWTRLDFDTRSPYEDARPPLVAGKPEERRYRLIYFIDGKIVGVWSDTINIITLP